MNENDQIVRNDLGDVIADAQVADCRLEFRRQRGTGDIWCVASGPLAVIAVPVLSGRGVGEASRLAALDHHVGQRSRSRYANWQRARITDDVLIAFRARGSDLEFAYLLGDGRPFGGGGGWLPTARRATLLERVQMWLSGRRGGRVEFTRHTDAGVR